MIICHVILGYQTKRPLAVQEATQDPKEKGLVLKIGDNLNDYLSCHIRLSNKKNQVWTIQPHCFANLQDTFGEK